MNQINGKNKSRFYLISSFVLFITLVLGSATYYLLYARAVNSASQRFERIKNHLIKDINYYFEGHFNKVFKVISENEGVFSKLDSRPEEVRNTQLSEYLDALFINSEGVVKFSLKSEIPLESNIYEKYKDSALTKLNDQIKITAQNAISEYSTLPGFKDPALYLGVAIFSQDKYLGNILLKVDVEDIHNIIQTYIGKLPKSGNIYIAKRDEKRSLVLFATKSNKDAAFNEYFNLKQDYPINLALKGDENTDTVNVDDNDILASKGIILSTMWAVSVEQLLQDVVKNVKIIKLLMFFILILFLIVLSLYIFFSYNVLCNFIRERRSAITYILILLAFIFSIFAFAFQLKKYNESKIKLDSQLFIQTKLKVEHVASLILQNLNEIKSLNSTLSYGLTQNKLDESNIENVFYKEIQKYSFIKGLFVAYAPNQYKEDVKLYGQYYLNQNDKIEKGSIDKVYDYTTSEWFKQTAHEKKQQWFDPKMHKDILSDLTVMSAMPFYDSKQKNNLKGVVAVLFDYNALKEQISMLGKMAADNSIIFNKMGRVVYSKNTQSVLDNDSFLFVNENVSKNLDNIVIRGSEGYSGYVKFTDKTDKQSKWAFYEALPTSDWTLVIYYPESHLTSFNTQQYNLYINLICWLTLLLVFLIMLISKVYLFKMNVLSKFAILYSLSSSNASLSNFLCNSLVSSLVKN